MEYGEILSNRRKNQKIKDDIKSINKFGNSYFLYKENDHTIRKTVKYFNPISPNFFEESGIPQNLQSYSVEEYAQKIQDWFNEFHGEKKLKLFIFNEKFPQNDPFSPYFKGQLEEGDDFDIGVPIFYYKEDGIGHFCGIRNMNSLFYTSHNYCYYCESTYGSKDNHTVFCKQKCLGCNGVGKGFPCKRDPNFINQMCPDCNRIFKSQLCFDRHKKLNKRRFKVIDEKGNKKFVLKEYSKCSHMKGCKDCGKTFIPSRLKEHGITEHNCSFIFCNICHEYHSKGYDKCFVTKIIPKKATPYRKIPFDFESTQKTLTSKKGTSYKEHVVNLVCAELWCTDCKEKKMKDLNPDCEVCGKVQEFKTRRVCWSAMHVDENGNPINEEQIIHNGETYPVKYSKNPLKSFVKWLENLPVAYDSICFAHNGGRY